MFTGIVEELGSVASRDGGRFSFAASVVVEDAKVGDSIAVNGACLTVVEVGATAWSADAVGETLARTNLAGLAAGDTVNLERSLRLGDRLAGHLVQGHVDGVAEVVVPAPALTVAVPHALVRYVVEKGPIALDGVSLTVTAVDPEHGHVSVAVVPHTAAVTTLGRRGAGARVNVEVDLLAKYVESLAAWR
ncbi:MAG: riboflavin synthase [Acidimicrobiales bacterium]